MREALFSILGDVNGLRVLDLFAGSGALGIEALSRGASEAVFVDRDPRAIAAVRRNLDAVGAEAAVVQGHATTFIGQRQRAYDLVFVDPPYDSAHRLAESLSERLPALLTDNARIVIESDKRQPLLLDLPLELERSYGDTRIAVHHA